MAIVNDEQVMKVLRQYNPWWRIPSAIKEESEDMQAIYFLYQQVMRELRSAQLKDQAMSQK